MNKLRPLLREATRHLRAQTQWTRDQVRLTIPFDNGRRQRITIESQGDRLLFTSIVLGPSKVTEIGKTNLLPWLWQRNREIDVVSFDIDRRGRLTGVVEAVADTLDSDELVTYIKLLAYECDRLEYVLTGSDAE